MENELLQEIFGREMFGKEIELLQEHVERENNLDGNRVFKWDFWTWKYFEWKIELSLDLFERENDFDMWIFLIFWMVIELSYELFERGKFWMEVEFALQLFERETILNDKLALT